MSMFEWPPKSRDQAWEREQAEPHETPRGLPLLMAVLLGAVGAWGATYFWYEAGDGSDYLYGDGRIALRSVGRQGDPEVLEARADASPEVDGKRVYASICAACHQANGQGVAGAFPPLVQSRWVLEDPRRPIGIVLQGLAGEIEVRGQVYQGVMPAFGEQLSDEEIAAVLTYIRSAWGHDAEPVTPEQVAPLRERLKGTGSLQGEEQVKALSE